MFKIKYKNIDVFLFQCIVRIYTNVKKNFNILSNMN